jgi:hypothetical protein
MPTELSHPFMYREKALNALVEIRACYSDMQAFVAAAFDRLDKLVDELGTPNLAAKVTKWSAEQDSMQEQIDRLARLANDLAESVAEQKRVSVKPNHAQPEELET